MKKYLKLVAAVMALIGVVMMFFTQAVVKWTAYPMENVAIRAIVSGGEFKYAGEIYSVASGLAGYILLGSAALILLVVALVPYFKEHDILSAVVTGIAVIALIVGTVLLFLIRKNFAEANGLNSEQVYVGWAAIVAGSLGSLSAATGALAVVLDLANN